MLNALKALNALKMLNALKRNKKRKEKEKGKKEKYIVLFSIINIIMTIAIIYFYRQDIYCNI